MRRHFLVLFTALMALTSLTVQAQYSVYMTSYGDSKINVIKAVREFRTDLGLAEAKTLVESVPCFVLEGVSYSEASTALESLTTAGATAEIVEGSTPPTPSDNHEYGSFNALYLSDFGTGKLAVVKAVRVATGMGLADANSLVSSVPTMIYNVLNESQTANLIHTLDSVGAAYSVYQAGYCNEGQTLEWYRSPAGKVTIRGTGAMYDYDRLKYGEFQSPWTSNGDTSDYGEDFSYAIEELAVEEGVTSIGSWAFAFCDQLTTITLPSTLTSIGEGAFQYCDELTTIYANSALDNMSTNAFGDWYNRSNITVYASDAETYGFWRDNGFNVVRDYEDPNAMTIYLQVTDEGNSLYAIENDYLTVSAWLGEEEGCVGSMEFGYDYEIGSYIKLTIYPDDLANAATVAGRTLRFMIYYFGNEGLASNETPTLPVDGEFWIHPSCIKLNGTQTTITYQQGATYGSSSNPIELEYVHLNQLSLPAVIEATIGETILLNDLLTYSPSNASIPTYDPIWEMSETECIMLGEDEESHPTLEVLSLPEEEVWIKANYDYVESSRANIVITDPNAFVLWATLTVDGQPLGVSQKFVPAADFCEIQAFAGFSQIGEDANAIITGYDRSDESHNYTSLYRISIPYSEYYVGQTLSFVLNSHTDNLGGITPPMPSDGRYLIRDVKTNTGKISDPIVYQPGATLGSAEEPYNLNYVTPTSVNVFQPYTANVGDIFTVEDLLDITPSNASLLFPINWNLDDNPFVLRTEENMLEAVSPSGETGPSVNIFMGDDFSTTFQAPIVVNDPTGCTYYVTVTANHESIPVQWGIPSDYDYIDVIPYLNGEAISDPIGCKRVETAATPTEAGSVKCIYAVRIDASQYAGQTIEFHVTTHYDESIIGYSNEIEANALPLSGEYIIRDVSWENYASASRMPVNAGTVYGSANNPIDLCYITPEEVSTTPSAIDLTEGETFDLSVLTFDFLPANSSVPVAFEPSWGIGDVTSDYLSLSSATPGAEPTILKGLAATEGSLNVNGYTDEMFFQVPVTISEMVIPVTGIQATTTETQILWANGEWVEGENVLVLDDLYTIAPSNATNTKVTWKSSNDCVALSDSGNEFDACAWYAYGMKVGTGTLTVTTDDGGFSTKVNFEVRNHVKSIELSQYEFNMQRGVPFDMSSYVSVVPSDAYNKAVRWECDAAVATISGNTITPKVTGEFILNVVSAENPDISNECTVYVTAPASNVYAVNPTQELWIGENADLSVRFEPADATSSVKSWTSSNTNVIAISGNGSTAAFSATAKAAGTATLTVTTDNGKTATIKVTVKAHVESITLGEQAITVAKGSTTVLDSYLTVLPANAYDKSVTWAVNDTATVVTVSQDKATGKWQMKANRSGTTALKVTSNDNPQASAFLAINVESHVTGIRTTSETQVLWVGEILPLDDLYTIIPADAANQDVTWTSSNAKVICYEGESNEYGGAYAQAVGAGTATLTVTTAEGGYKGTIYVEVRAHVESITLSQQALTLQRGSNVDLSQYVTVLPANAYDKAVTWKSSNTSIVSISGSTAVANAIGQTTLTVSSAENAKITARLTITVTAPASNVYAVNPAQELWIGENADLSVRFEPADATSTVKSWTSSNTNVVAISLMEAGYTATAKAAGTATLTVTTDNGKTATIEVTVKAHVESITLSEQVITVAKGSTTVLDSYLTVQPANAYDKSVTWAVNDTATVVTVSQDKATGKWQMKANRSGTTALKVTSNDNPQASAFLAINVESHVTGIRTTSETQVLWVGEILPLDDLYTIIPADAANQNVTWTSSNAKVISYEGESNEYGGAYAQAVGAGTATLTVTTAEGGYKGTINVEVRAHVESITLSQQALTLQRGSTADLAQYVTVLPANAFDKTVTWKSADETIVSVNGNTAIAMALGTTTLTVSSAENAKITARLTITVEAAAAGVYAVNPVQELWIGEKADLSIYFEPKDATSTVKSWTSSNTNVVAISLMEAGYTATAKAAGKATLTVTTDNGQKATIEVTVKAHVSSLQLSEQALTVAKGSTTALDTYLTVLPANAYDKSVTWAVTDTATVVSVSQDKATGKWQMKANRSGSTTLKVTSNDNPQASAFLTVNVESHVTGIKTTNETQVLWVGETLSLNGLYTIIPTDAANQNVTWSSNNTKAVSIDQQAGANGPVAKALAVGTATLTVTTAEGGYKGTINVEVRAHVASITLSQQALTLQRGSNVDLSQYVTVLPANAFDKTVSWKSENAAIVSVNGNTAVAKALGTTTLTVASNDNPKITARLTITVEAAAAGVYAVSPVQQLWIGENADLSIRFEPADATSTIKSWTSSNTNVVAISRIGTGYTATAKAAGTATLTVTTDNGQKATIEVTVKAHVSSLQLSEKAITVAKGSTTALDTYLTVLPANAYDKSVTWAVSDTATVVTVSQDKATGKWQFKANRSGSTTLKVTSNDNPQASAFLTVNVESHVTGIKTTSETQVLWVGETLPLNGLYTIQPADASNKNVTWTTSNSKVATIDQQAGQNGPVAKALAVGTATLTVTTAEGGYKGTVNIEVRAHVESIALSEQAITLQRGSTADLSQYITVLPANAFNKAVTWKSSDASIVSINGSTAIAKAIGTTTLTVTSDENPKITARLTVTVEAAAAGVYAVNPVQTIAVGEKADLSIFFEPVDATSAVKSWTSSNTNVVAISGNGTTTAFVATAKAAGTATLTVTTDNGQKATIEVTVYGSLEEITLSVSEVTLEKGETLDLSKLITTEPATGLYDLTIKYLPKEGSEHYFTVDNNGKVTALESTCGDSYEVEILVTDGFGNAASAVINIGVTVTPTDIHLEAATQSILVGGELNLGYTVLPEGADLPADEKWSSSNKKVVSVALTEEGWKAYAEGVGQATVTLTLGDLQATINVEVYSIVERILLNTQGEQINQGETICLDDFIVGFEPEDAADKRVIWKAEDEKIVTITQKDGKYYATGLAEGSTSLMVQSVANPEVASYMSLFVRTAIVSITALYPEQYVFTDTYVDLSVEILPAEAADRYVDWTCSDPEAMTFYADPYTGKYMPQFSKYGDFTLTGTPDEGEHTCTITVHVVKHVEEITLTTTEPITLEIGQSQSLDDLFTIIPDDAYNKDVIWTSNDESVATVNGADGHWTVNGISSGITMLNVVSVDNPDAMARIEVSVIRRVTGITVEEPEQTLYPGDYVNTMYTILPEDADNMDVTFSISDEDILGFDKNEIDNFSCLKALRPGEATVTITTDEGGYAATIHVTVATAIEEIMLSTDTISLDINETVDLNDYITAILPEDALDKSVYWTIGWVPDTYMTIAEDGHTATTLKETREPFQISVHAQSGYAYKHVWVEIYCHPKRIVVDQSEQAVELNEAINLGYKVLPEGARYNPDDIVWVSSDQSIVHVGHDAYMTHMTEEICAVAKKPGTATLTVSLPKENLSATISVTVNAPTVESIYCDWPDIMKGESTSVSVYSSPEYSIIDPEKLEISLVDDYGTWKPFTYALTTDEEGNAAIEVEALTWGQYRMQLDYPGTKGNAIWMYFGQPINLEKGWNWVSLANATYPIEGIKNISLAFDDKLIDARTIDDALYLDPTYGLFGTLTTFQGGSYKMEVSDNVCLQNHKVEYDINSGFTTTLHEGWNWITYPYDQNYSLYELNTYGAFSTPVKGDRIVSKDGGFSEYGTYSWSGTLDQLNESEGYMYYTSESHSIQWPAPSQLGQKDAYGYKATSRRTLVDTNDIWQYDHRLFADNMTIIATVKGLDFPDDCTIGAFVDGTCRGMGTYVDGKFFITVHGKVGESVTFVIHDDATDSYYNVPGSLSFDNMIGSLDHPLPLKAGEKTTAIELRSTDIDDSSHSFYDLSGRRLISPATGVYIQDGKLIYIK